MMMPALLEFMDLWKTVRTERMAADRYVNPGPCYLFSATLVSTSAGVSTASIYDGAGTGGERKVDLSAYADGSDPRSWYPPLVFNQGLYIDVGSNVSSVVVQFLPIKR
jgi:hypothetical protein